MVHHRICCDTGLKLWQLQSSLVFIDSNFSPFLLHPYPTAKSNSENNRHLVTVTIGFSAPNDALANDFNNAVVSEIRNAIAAGTFTRD